MGTIPHTIVIGGGISGIAAAWHLAKAGLPVTLIESRTELGGRLCSHTHKDIPTPFDNGPHLFLSMYNKTLRLFKDLGISEKLEFPWPGAIPFAQSNGRRETLNLWPLPSPLNMAAGLLTFPLLSWSARRRTISTAQELLSKNIDAAQSAEDWLHARWNDEEREIFWVPLIKAALNTTPHKVSIRDLQTILKEGFCKGFFGGRLGYAVKPLGQLFDENVRNELTKAGVNILLRTTVSGAVVEGGKLAAVLLKDGTRLSCDAVVAALLPWAAAEWLSSYPEGKSVLAAYKMDVWKTNSIHSIYLWADQRPLLDAYTCLPDTQADWLFDFGRIWGTRQGPICLILNELHKDIRPEKERSPDHDISRLIELINERFPQLQRVKWKAIKRIEERRAIPLRPRELWGKTLSQTTSIPNLFVAGDWLDSDLPPTIEAAVRSGEKAGKLLD